MKVKTITLSKQLKVGLPNYSNIDVAMSMTVDMDETDLVAGEPRQPVLDRCWDIVNHELSVQTEGIEPTWIIRGEYPKYFEIKIRVPKKENNA